MAQPQLLENVWQVYNRIIDETLKASAQAQSTAVLEQLKKRWVAHLSERIRADAEAPKCQDLGSQAASTVSRGILKGARLKVEATPADAKSGTSVTGVGEPLFDRRKMAPDLRSDTPGRLPWAVADRGPAPCLAALPQSDPWAAPVVKKQEKPTESVTQEAPTPDKEPPAPDRETAAPEKAEDVEEEDEWGDWESAEGIAAAVEERQVKPPPVAEVAKQPQPEEKATPPLEEGYTDHEGNYVPTEADFATRVRTQYGRGQAVGDVVTAGQSDAWGADPDVEAIDSDLDDVSDFSDDEPQARDVIVAQVETVTRPPGRKAQSQGLWKIKARNGVARIDGQEIFFDTLYADLEF